VKRPDRVAGRWVAMVLGAGLVPLAPGTAGSVISAGIFLLVRTGNGLPRLLLAPILLLGYWGCFEGRKAWGDDPSRVVIDEFAGCWVACLGAPVEWGVWGVLAALALFRVFDIFKPWPVSRFDSMDSSLGILLDDVAAGFLSVLVMVLVDNAVAIA